MVTNKLIAKSSNLVSLVDSTFNNEGDLLGRAGLKCYEVERLVVQYFCKDDVYDRERKFIIKDSKCSVSLGTFDSKNCDAIYEKAHNEAVVTGNNWLDSPSPFWQSFYKQKELEPIAHKKALLHFKDKHQKYWLKEIKYFSKNYHKKYNSDDPKAWLKMVKDLSFLCANNLGFVENKKISTGNKILFLKKINNDWSVYLGFDLHHLRLRLNNNHLENKHIEFLFGLVCNETSSQYPLTNKKQVKSILQFNYFFSVGNVFHHYLKEFDTLEELETIININFKLYETLMQAGFEEVLK